MCKLYLTVKKSQQSHGDGFVNFLVHSSHNLQFHSINQRIRCCITENSQIINLF